MEDIFKKLITRRKLDGGEEERQKMIDWKIIDNSNFRL